MDRLGRWAGDVPIERLLRSLNYDCIDLRAFETHSELRAGLMRWIGYYDSRRLRSMLTGRTPDGAYWATGTENWRPDNNRDRAHPSRPNLSNAWGPPQTIGSIQCSRAATIANDWMI
jgi:hypothetical protein